MKNWEVREIKPSRIIAIATVLLAGCMTHVDYSKPRPLKEGKAKRARTKLDLLESEGSIVTRKILKFLGKLGGAGRRAFD